MQKLCIPLDRVNDEEVLGYERGFIYLHVGVSLALYHNATQPRQPHAIPTHAVGL